MGCIRAWGRTRRVRLRHAVGLAALALVAAFALHDVGAVAPAAEPQYTADGSTVLFEDFEGSSLADSVSAGVAFTADGWLGGKAVSFADTAAYLVYSDSWWAANDEGSQESGTIECYVRIDSFPYTPDTPYLLILSNRGRLNPSVTGGDPVFGFFENSAYFAVSNPPGYSDVQSPDNINVGQWYHFAATWGAGGRRMYINGVMVDNAGFDTNLVADTFYLGSPPFQPTQKAAGIVGRIDRLRISALERQAGQMPSALDVRIDTPSVEGFFTVPFPVTFEAFASDSRPRLVDIYVDTDEQGFNGTPVSIGLPESGTFLIGFTAPADSRYLYAVARAGGDSAYRYGQQPFQAVAGAGIDTFTDPTETTAVVAAPPTSSTTFTTVLLNNGGTVSGTLASAINSTGANANYQVEAALLNPQDTVILHIWTKEVSGAVMLGLRSDTASLGPAGLPYGISANDAGRRALGATTILTEFVGANGQMIGDTATTSYLGESFAYTLEYRLSAATKAYYDALGFNTAAGSRSFSFYFADTYGGRWIEDSTVIPSVEEESGGGIVVRVPGIRRDLPGGLGAVSAALYQTRLANEADFCVISALDPPGPALVWMREIRDVVMATGIGRFLVGMYYRAGGALRLFVQSLIGL